jgi:hypothetical protein
MTCRSPKAAFGQQTRRAPKNSLAGFADHVVQTFLSENGSASSHAAVLGYEDIEHRPQSALSTGNKAIYEKS